MAWLIVLAALWAWRGEVLDSPPYYETAQGLFYEANFLAETGFDYRRLRYDELPGNRGGPYCYMTSVQPTLLALAMRHAGSVERVLMLFHSFYFVAAAAMGAGLLALVRPYAGGLVAGLLAAATLTTPLCITQIEMGGMDVPMAALAVLGLVAFDRGRLGWSAAALTGAFLMKAPALLVTAAVLSVSVLAACCQRAIARGADHAEGDRARADWRGVGLLAGALALQLAIHQAGGISQRLKTIPFAGDYLRQARFAFPDVLAISSVILLACGLVWLFATGRALHEAGWRGLFPRAVAAPARWRLAAAIALALALTFFSIRFVVRGFVIRYFFLPVVLLYALAGCVLFSRRPARWAGGALLAAVCVLNVANRTGRFFPEPQDDRRHCGSLERSGEYWADHQANLAAFRQIEAACRTTPYVAGIPFTYFFSMPQLGYVREPIEGYGIFRLSRPEVRDIFDLFRDHPTELVFFVVDNPSHRLGPITAPLPEPGDEVLFDDGQASPLIVFRKRLDVLAADHAALDRWYLEHLWFSERTAASAPPLIAERVAELQQRGRPDLALLLARMALDHGLEPRVFRGLAIQAALAARDWNAAASEARQLLEAHAAGSAPLPAPARADAERWLGEALFGQGDLSGASECFERALEIEPRSALAWFDLGVVALALQRGDEARQALERAIQLAPEFAEAHYQLSLATAGDPATSLRHAQQAVKLDPQHALARQRLESLGKNAP